MGQHRDMWGTAGIYGARTGDVAPQGSMGQRTAMAQQQRTAMEQQRRDLWGSTGICGAEQGSMGHAPVTWQHRDLWSSAQLWGSAGMYGAAAAHSYGAAAQRMYGAAAQGSMGQRRDLWGRHGYGARTGDVAPQGSMGQRITMWQRTAMEQQRRALWGSAGICGAAQGSMGHAPVTWHLLASPLGAAWMQKGEAGMSSPP